ncbi:hypothetical protein F2Q68_00036535 [Brassica cretica]|uniref:Protein kinase domain-containing protein n=1 Tax=Brassica cretica TaxID=69181 RepID=A0A8S9HBU5_BRACR|nr:hypothetical protein F2Q68_00036535 [Brassica cretica]
MANTNQPVRACVIKVDLKCCSSCLNRVKTKLQSLPGVTAAEYNVKKRLMTVAGDVDPMTLVYKLTKPNRKTELVSVNYMHDEDEDEDEDDTTSNPDPRAMERAPQVNTRPTIKKKEGMVRKYLLLGCLRSKPKVVQPFPLAKRMFGSTRFGNGGSDHGGGGGHGNAPSLLMSMFSLVNLWRKVSKNWHIPATFPSEAVISAYLNPQVDRSTEIFSWGKPDLLVLRKLCWEKFGWNGKKTDDLLLPVLKEYEKRETQLRMEAFYSFSERFAKIRSKRIKKAVKGIGGGLSSEVVDHTLQEGPRKGNKKRLSPYESEDNTSEKDLNLSLNSLTGNIPGEVGLFSNLRYLNLSWNHFNTRVPPEIEFLQNLTVLDLRNGALIGSVPADICEAQSLQILQLDEELKILKLEANKLSGEIPKELGKLQNLLLVNISFNRLIGRLPSGGVFQSLDQSALQGNLGICSPLLRGPCTLNVPKPLVIDPNSYRNGNNNQEVSGNRASKFHGGMFLSVSVIVAISAAILIVSGIIIITLLNASVRRRLAFVDTALESIFSGSSRSGRSLEAGKLVLLNSRTSRSSSSSQEFSRNPESVLNKASRIGEGVFGTVYKAPLGEHGRNLAVKKLVPSPIIENLEDFDREVRILAKAKHPNLVSMKGYYWTPEMQLLVSEYIPNGNLQSKLHEREPSTPPLPWDARYRIILGTAKGLAYLHHTFRPATVHFNLKPTNILLDEKYNPKISDFGLARLLTTQDGNTMNTNRFQNALGYVAPELECQNLRVNEKCDVYGFGVLILELVTARRPVEYGEDSFVILSDHVRVLLEQGNVLECIDPTMEGEYSEDEVLPVLKLALVCTSQIPSNRPTMAEIVQILQVISSPVPHRMLDSF